jgi:glycopeptide antibiotics resistance protein
VPCQGNFILRVKDRINYVAPLLYSFLRSSLHILLLFAPTLVSFALIGRNRSLILAILLAIAIEAAQTLFGYGFDAFDVLDLLFDAAGILLAAWVFENLQQKYVFLQTRIAPCPSDG